jgi:hypothetical protein
VGLGREFDFGGCGLGGQEGSYEAEECAALHAANCSSRSGLKPCSYLESDAALKRRSSMVSLASYFTHRYSTHRIASEVFPGYSTLSRARPSSALHCEAHSRLGYNSADS